MERSRAIEGRLRLEGQRLSNPPGLHKAERFRAYNPPVAFRIELLGGFRLTCHGREVASGHKRLLALLAARAPTPVKRRDLVALLYPNDPRPQAQNRIRVGLARLRSTLPLCESPEDVALGAIDVDVSELRRALREANQSLDPSHEKRLFEEKIECLAKPLLPEIEEDWAEDERSAWALEAVGALARLAELASEHCDAKLQLLAAQCGLGHLPFDEELWSHAITAAGKLGQGDEILKLWKKSRYRLKREGSDYSDELQELADNIRDQSNSANATIQLSPSEEEVLRRLFVRAINEDPTAVRSLLASPALVPEIMRRPDEVERLVRFAMRDGAESEPSMIACQVHLVDALGFSERWHEAFVEGDRLLAGSLDVRSRRRLLSNLAFGRIVTGDPGLALRHLEALVEICIREGWEYELWLARCHQAAFLWTSLQFEESESLFRDCLSYLKSVSGRDVVQNIAVVETNLACLLADLGKWKESHELAQGAAEVARKRGHAQNEARAALGTARALFHLGKSGEAVAFARRGLRRAARTSDQRLHVNCLELLALGLVGSPWSEEGRRLLLSTWSLRLGCEFPTNMLFGYWHKLYLPGQNPPPPKTQTAEALAAAYRILGTFELDRDGEKVASQNDAAATV